MLESAPPLPEDPPNESVVEEEVDESSDSGGAETDDPEPVPASSDGPAENWPEPDIPEAIHEPTEEGAEALIQYWFDARHHARITGEVAVLEYVSLDECEVCTAEVSRVDEAYPEGWYVEEMPNQVEDAFVKRESDSVVSGLFVIDEVPFELYWDGVLHSEQVPDSLEVFGLDVRYDDGHWQVFHFSHLGPADNIDNLTSDSMEEESQ